MEVVLIFLCSLLAPAVLASGKCPQDVAPTMGSHGLLWWEVLALWDSRFGALRVYMSDQPWPPQSTEKALEGGSCS